MTGCVTEQLHHEQGYSSRCSNSLQTRRPASFGSFREGAIVFAWGYGAYLASSSAGTYWDPMPMDKSVGAQT